MPRGRQDLGKWHDLQGALSLDTEKMKQAERRARVLRRIYLAAEPGDNWRTLRAKAGLAPRALAWLRRKYPRWEREVRRKMAGEVGA